MAANFRINDDGEDLGDALLVKDEIPHSLEERQLDFEQPGIATRRSRWNPKLSTFSSAFWVLFSVWSILTARRVLTDEFPYPICFLVLLQSVAYICVTWFVLLIVMGDLLRDRKRSCQGTNATFTVAQMFVIFVRYCLTVCFSMAALILSTEALMRFDNFSVLVMLPVLAYAIDSILFSFAHAVRLLPRDHGPDHWVVLWAVVVCVAIAVIVYDDYRITPAGVIYAIVGIFCGSVGRLIAGIGPQVPRIGLHTWDCSSFWFLWAGMPPCLLITVYMAIKYENVWNAYQILTSWDMAIFLSNVAPGVLTHLLLNTQLRSTFQISTTEGAAYQIGGENVVDAIDATLYVSLLLLPISTLYEDNIVDWVQIGAFVFVFIISVGPKQISLYLPRFINFARRRSRESKWYAFWHRPLVLCTTTAIFALLTSAILMYWTNRFAFERSKGSWPGGAAVLDTVYRAPTRDRLEIVIAHSENDPIESVQEIISLMTGMSSILFFNPIITVYTKSTSENVTHQIVDGTGIDEANIKPLKNTGGVTATFLHHMLTKWDTLSTQTMFFHASSTTAQNLELIHARINDFYTGPAGYPYPENLFASSGFLNLGDFTTCNCHSCYEPTTNWRDTFSLLPSMWGASHPSTPDQPSPSCQNILLTHGNNFIASAQRIRGIKKDVWTTLFEALTKEDLSNAWAHDKKKIGWAEGDKQMRIEGKVDSLEEPFLGYTVERLWAVLLQCSNREIAWKCPGMWSGWRNGGGGADCGCIDTWGT